MSESPLVSIIITSYNYARFLREAIDSALSQTYRHTEVIVVDDGSTDESPDVISSYGGRIIPLLRKHEGPRFAYSAAFAASRGDVVVFLDSDDALLPTAVEKAVRFFEVGKVAKIHWPLWEINKDSKTTGGIIPETALSDGDLRDTLVKEGPDGCTSPPMSGNAWARKVLEKIFPIEIDGDFHFDTYFSVVASALGPVKAILDPQGYYRIHGTNIFASHPSDVRNRKNLNNYNFSCQALSQSLADNGIVVDPQAWKSDNHHYQWMDMQDLASEELKSLIPAGDTFILVDENNWGDGWGSSEVIADRHSVPFLEREGQYWGPPSDDVTAIAEFERLRQAGSNFIVFAWPAFWWLEYYSDLARHLRSHFRCVIQNERVIAFDIQRIVQPNETDLISLHAA